MEKAEQQISEESLYNLLKLTFEENIQNYMAPHHALEDALEDAANYIIGKPYYYLFALECLFSFLEEVNIEEIGKEYIKA